MCDYILLMLVVNKIYMKTFPWTFLSLRFHPVLASILKLPQINKLILYLYFDKFFMLGAGVAKSIIKFVLPSFCHEQKKPAYVHVKVQVHPFIYFHQLDGRPTYSSSLRYPLFELISKYSVSLDLNSKIESSFVVPSSFH